MQFIGIDFGTSNSLACLYENERVQFVEFSDGNNSNPTILYFPNASKQHFIGNEAIQFYLDDLEEEKIIGRLMQSIKTLLPDASFDHTFVNGRNFTVTDLVARFLISLKELAEEKFSQKFEGVVLGRPVHFSELALERLENAAKSAGFKEVIFWLEPVAAALGYEATTTEDELVCVVDIGGGTTDICVVETSPSRSQAQNRLADIKAVNGVNVAGDELNAMIMRHKLAPRFGEGSTYVSLNKVLPFPLHIIGKLSRWHWVSLLKNANDISTINEIYPTSSNPQDLERLLTLIRGHYGFELFRAIDSGKKDLSEYEEAIVKFMPLTLREEISRNEFENMISPVTEKIEKSILDTLNFASIKPTNIKRVLLTGGSAQVPILNNLVEGIFGKEKVLRPDFLSSVATGLGYVAARCSREIND